MKFTVILFLVLVAFSLNAHEDWRTRPEGTRDQAVQDLIHTYCGDKPRPPMLRIKNFDGTVHDIQGVDFDAAKASDPLLQVITMQPLPKGSEYVMCEDMVLKKAIDSDFLAMDEENKLLNRAFNSICDRPDIGSPAKAACLDFSREYLRLLSRHLPEK